MAEVSEIIEFLLEKTGKKIIYDNSDLRNDLGVDGDDYYELIDEFSKKFNVDVSSCLWYFHWTEEGSWNSLGSLFHQPPNKRVKYIPVTPKMLSEFSKSGKWEIDYPQHELPKRRYDILINQIIFVAFILFLILKYLF